MEETGFERKVGEAGCSPVVEHVAEVGVFEVGRLEAGRLEAGKSADVRL